MVNKNGDEFCFDGIGVDFINAYIYINGKSINNSCSEGYGGNVSVEITTDDVKELYNNCNKTYLWGIDTSNGSLVRLDHVEPDDDYIDIALDKLKENTKMYDGIGNCLSIGVDFSNSKTYSGTAYDLYIADKISAGYGDWYVDNEIISWLTFDKENKKESNMNYFWYNLKAERVYAFALPGVGKENIKVRADERHLYIEAKADLKNENAISSSACGFDFDTEYKASFKLEKKFDLSRVDSKYVDGVLYVYIPFNDEYVLKDIKVK